MQGSAEVGGRDGWCIGTIISVNEDARRTIAGDKVNFFVHYDGEEEPAPHVLRLSAYDTSDSASYDSWLLFMKQVNKWNWKLSWPNEPLDDA